jgi:hypothetical protein
MKSATNGILLSQIRFLARGRQAVRAISFVALSAALSVATAAIAQPRAPAPANSPAAPPTLQGFGDRDKTCLAWTDDCRSCRREADNTVNCSNIGIACQPAEIRCTAKQEPAK